MKKKITIALVMIFAVLAYITCASQILDANAEGMSVIMGGKTLETGYYWYVGNQMQDVSQTAPDATVIPNYIHYDASTGIMTVYGNFYTEDMSGIQIDGGTLILSGAGDLTIVSNVDGTAAITGANGAGIRTEEGFSGDINISGKGNASAIHGLTTVALETTSANGIWIMTSQSSGVFIDAENVSLKGPDITFDSQAASLSGIIRATGDISLVSDEDISIVNDCSGAMFTGSNVTLESTAREINLENTTSGIATGNLTMRAAGNIYIEAKDAVANGNLNITNAKYGKITSYNAVTVGGNMIIKSENDLTIANFEGTLTDSDEREDKTFAFKAPASYASILTDGSVEAVNTANNHSHDYGEQSFDDTLAALDDAGIVHFGYDETAVMDVKGIKVGLVGIYELYDHLEREQQLKDNIAKVKADGAQLIVVIFHWGNETETVPDSNQTTLGRIAIDEGADLVCGHHPHVLQGIETYKGRNIVYSLGNFCFGGNSSPSDMDTMIYQQTFTIDADGVKKDNVTNIIPCSISSAAYDGYNNYQPTPAEGDEATRILGKINERSSWISTAEGSTFTAKYNSNNDSQSSSADTAASDSDIVDMNSSASDDTDAETYDESCDTDNSDAE